MNLLHRQNTCLRPIMLLGVCGLVVCLAGLGCRRADSPSSEPARPNVLLIVLDTARADYLSCYGHHRNTSPHLDQLAAEGIRFDRAYATDFWTLPSHASLLTGLYPSAAGATAETNHLPDHVTTLAERLRDHGYRTGAVIHNAWISRERGFAQGFSEYVEMWRKRNHPTGVRVAPGDEQAGVERAIAWIDRQLETRQTPFFLFVNFNVAHLPYTPPQSIRTRFATQQWPPARVRRVMQIVGMWGFLAGKVKLDQTDFQIMRELYQGEIARADDYVGQLVDALGSRSIKDNTLIIVTSDHGENLGEHGMIDHLLSMHETTLHIPLIIRYPERFTPGTTCADLVSLIDVVPTVLDICGLLDQFAPPGAERISLGGDDRLRRKFIMAENERPVNGVKLLNRESPAFDTTAIDRPMRAIRSARYKLIWHEGHKVELFDLQSDPSELHNVAENHPQIRDQLLLQLKGLLAQVVSGTESQAFESQDAESLRRLRSLGYID